MYLLKKLSILGVSIGEREMGCHRRKLYVANEAQTDTTLCCTTSPAQLPQS